MEKPYSALRVLTVVFRVVAWGALTVGILGAGGVLTGAVHDPPRPAGLVILAVGSLYFCLFSALSGILSLLLVLEERTRHTP